MNSSSLIFGRVISREYKGAKGKRNEAIRAAHLEYGYGLSEIANRLSFALHDDQ
jgi:hypothetical protein